jgi:branched-chain amino acid aminotransferase
MARIVSIDGALLAAEDAKVSVFDRGFLYGDSVFETVRTYRGEPFALAEHLARLALSASRVAIAVPISSTEFAIEVRLAVRAARNPESSARVMLTRGSGPVGLDPALADAPLRVILVEPLSLLSRSLYRDGAQVITVRTERAADATQGGAKVGNYLASLLALRHARSRGAHEALILDARGHVVEGTTSNVFVVQDGELVTPPEHAGILLGITRAHVLELAAERGTPAREAMLKPSDLISADEVFICSSLREIVPVVRVDDYVVATGVPGQLTRVLHRAFRGHVGMSAEPMPWE